MAEARVEAGASGRAALEAFDRALEHGNQRDLPDLTQLVEHLCDWRDELTARHRAGSGDDQALARLNGVLSVVLTWRFPLGKLPWPSITAARDEVDDLVLQLNV